MKDRRFSHSAQLLSCPPGSLSRLFGRMTIVEADDFDRANRARPYISQLGKVPLFSEGMSLRVKFRILSASTRVDHSQFDLDDDINLRSHYSGLGSTNGKKMTDIRIFQGRGNRVKVIPRPFCYPRSIQFTSALNSWIINPNRWKQMSPATERKYELKKY